MGWLSVVAVIVLWGHATQGCTIITLDNSGFASNAYSLLHALPIFYRRNGTFFLDNSEFNYRCSENGGWHEFFSGEDKIVPWSRPKELAHGPDCARFRREDVDAITFALMQSKPEPLDFIGIKMVRPFVVNICVSFQRQIYTPGASLHTFEVLHIKSAGRTLLHMITIGVPSWHLARRLMIRMRHLREQVLACRLGGIAHGSRRS